jgi:hypothetical protein
MTVNVLCCGVVCRLCMVLGTTVVALSFILLGPVVFPIAPSPLQVGIAMAVHGVGMAANFIGKYCKSAKAWPPNKTR